MIKHWLHVIGLSFQYFSRLPLPFSFNYNKETVKRTIFFLPFIGWFIGFIPFILFRLLHGSFPNPLLAVLIVTAMIWITGGLHADGWMDVWDGLGSSQTKDKMLTIMQDSRVGAMGVIGFTVLFAIKVTSLIALLTSNHITEALVYTPIVTRWGVLVVIFMFPYARTEGLGLMYKEWLTFDKLLLSFIWLIPIFFFTPLAFFLLITTLTFMILSGLYFTKKLAGLTGDVYGWLIEGGEALLWIVLTYIVYH